MTEGSASQRRTRLITAELTVLASELILRKRLRAREGLARRKERKMVSAKVLPWSLEWLSICRNRNRVEVSFISTFRGVSHLFLHWSQLVDAPDRTRPEGAWARWRRVPPYRTGQVGNGFTGSLPSLRVCCCITLARLSSSHTSTTTTTITKPPPIQSTRRPFFAHPSIMDTAFHIPVDTDDTHATDAEAALEALRAAIGGNPTEEYASLGSSGGHNGSAILSHSSDNDHSISHLEHPEPTPPPVSAPAQPTITAAQKEAVEKSLAALTQLNDTSQSIVNRMDLPKLLQGLAGSFTLLVQTNKKQAEIVKNLHGQLSGTSEGGLRRRALALCS